jgi:hypothetical protein
LNRWLGRAALIELKGGPGQLLRVVVLSVGVRNNSKICGRAELDFRTATPKTSGLATHRIFLLTSILSSTMCLPTNHPFLKPFSSLKKAITRPRSPLPQSTDITSKDLARPRSDLPILITPSSTIHAANIAMPVTGQLHSNLPAPKSRSITYQNQICR